ncbi:MAG TPA: hypothetical protein VG269_04790 [Tepidisphaeraceae bacterium]|jgi:hypothetical protein|nr:hypothetical protein [Tepidisphaeraceae bacterium]
MSKINRQLVFVSILVSLGCNRDQSRLVAPKSTSQTAGSSGESAVDLEAIKSRVAHSISDAERRAQINRRDVPANNLQRALYLPTLHALQTATKNTLSTPTITASLINDRMGPDQLGIITVWLEDEPKPDTLRIRVLNHNKTVDMPMAAEQRQANKDQAASQVNFADVEKLGDDMVVLIGSIENRKNVRISLLYNNGTSSSNEVIPMWATPREIIGQ